MRKILGHSLNEYDKERTKEKPDMDKILKLTKDIRASVRMISGIRPRNSNNCGDRIEHRSISRNNIPLHG